MQTTMDFDENDLLVRRLSALDFSEPETLIPRTLAASRSPRSVPGCGPRRVLIAAISLIGLLVANLGASYISPRYAQALAAVPGLGSLTGPILQQAGLAGTGAQSLDVRSTAAGYTVRVFGGYGDTVRTTVFLEILGPDGHPAPDGTAPTFGAELTDQFGHVYHMANGFGMPVIHFDPLTGPAATLGARLTLHIPDIGVNTAPSTAGTTVHGPWDLQFTLTSSGGSSLASPAPVRVGDTTYTFTAVRTTASLLEVAWTVTGGAVARMPTDHDRSEFDAISSSALLGPDGIGINPIYGFGHDVRQDGRPVAMEMDAWYPISGHGIYRFQVSNAATSGDMRTIEVP